MRAICSRVNIEDFDNFYAIEFFDCIGDLIDLQEVKDLDNFHQHLGTSRLQHSLNVAYHSYLIAKILHCDYRTVARAGILHDLYLYDWREVETKEHHAIHHPKAALENAKKITNLNKIEEEAIVKHMWPLCYSIPKYKESHILSIADKYCTVFEVVYQLSKSFVRKAVGLKNVFLR